MDVLLLNLADFIDKNGKENEYIIKQSAIPPLGLLYLGQTLNKNGYNVKIYDQTVTGEKNSKLIDIIKKFDPKIIGFSILISNFYTTIEIFNRIKEWNPNIITIAGNYYSTFFPELLMKEIEFDYSVRGEGEQILLELVGKIFNSKDCKEIKGITYRENDIVKSTPPSGLIKNIDEIPIPDRKLIDFNYKLQHKSTSILSSRGCPFNCRFCYFSAVMGRNWRPRSVKNIIEEISLLRDQGYKEILFADSNFTLNKKRIFRLCAEIKRNGYDDINYSGDCRIDNASYDMFRALVSINCKRLSFGMESGNQRILDYYKKGVNVEQIKQAVKTAIKSRVEMIYGSFIVGAPDETIDEVVNTIKFANKLNLSFVVFEILNTIPISSIYQELIKNGQYKPRDDDWKHSFDVPDICSTAIPKRILFKYIDEGFVRFFNNKKRNIGFVINSIKNNYYIDSVIQSIQNFRLSKERDK